MAREFQVGTVRITTLTATTETAISLSGFTGAPNFMLFFTVGRDSATSASGNANHDRCFGAATSASSRFTVSSAGTNGAADAEANSIDRTDCVINLLSHAATSVSDGRVDIASVSSSEVRLINDEVLGHAITIGYVIARFAVTPFIGTLVEPGTTGNQAVTGVGFQGQFALFASASTTAVDTIHNGSHFMLGAAQSSSSMALASVAAEDAAAITQTARCGMANLECITLIPDAVNNPTGRAAFVSWDSDGFTINWIERSSTRRVHYIVVDDGDWFIDSFSSSNVTSTTFARSGYGFAPSACLVYGAMVSTAQNNAGSHDVFTLGAATSTSNRWALFASDQDNVAAASIETAIRYDAVWESIDGRGDIQSFDSDGITFVQDDSDAAAGLMLVVAFRPPDMGGGGGSTQPARSMHQYRLRAS